MPDTPHVLRLEPAPESESNEELAPGENPDAARLQGAKDEVVQRYDHDFPVGGINLLERSPLEPDDATAITHAIAFVNALTLKAGKKLPSNPPLGDVYKKGNPTFDEAIGFIKGHANDHPNNAALKSDDVARIVILRTENHAAVVALDEKNQPLAVAD